jgi:hypothetical protein
MFPPKKIRVVLYLILLTSCYESLDFKQLNEFLVKPVFTLALNYFSIVPSQFISSNGTQQISISDITDIKGLQDVYITNDIVRLEFNAEIKNELDRGVTITVEFLDRISRLTYSFKAIIVDSKDLEYTYLETIDIVSYPDILNTSKVRVKLELENTGAPLNLDDTSEFEFKSSVTLFIESSF